MSLKEFQTAPSIDTITFVPTKVLIDSNVSAVIDGQCVFNKVAIYIDIL